VGFLLHCKHTTAQVSQPVAKQPAVLVLQGEVLNGEERDDGKEGRIEMEKD